jgi:microcystin-dependent protein
MTQRPLGTIQAELDAVQKRLSALEAMQQNGGPGFASLYRRRSSKGLGFGLALFAGLLFLVGGTLYAQGLGDALFIDQRGWIGIGTNNPNATLDVAGTLNVMKNASLADTTIKGALTVAGRIKDQSGYVMPVGSVLAYQGAAAPEGWLLCDGSAIPNEAKYQDLKTLLARSATPDLRGRTLIGAGQGAGLSLRALWQQGGEENHRLTIDEMPSHNHHGFGEAYNNYWPFGQVGKNEKGSRGGVDEDNFFYNTSSTGGSRPFNNMQPFHVVNYIIKY